MDWGTSNGTSACCAGIWNAFAQPSATDSTKSSSRVATVCQVAAASAAAITTCTAMQVASTLLRSTWSATWPATSVSSRAGRNWNRPTRPRSQALPVRSYICQPTATISIWLPVVPARRAYQKRMNAGTA